MGKRVEWLVGLLLRRCWFLWRCVSRSWSSKLLAFEKQLEDHEVAVVELDRQVAVLDLGKIFKRLSDIVDVTSSGSPEWVNTFEHNLVK